MSASTWNHCADCDPSFPCYRPGPSECRKHPPGQVAPNPDIAPIRGTAWLLDGIGIDGEGGVVVRTSGGLGPSATYHTLRREYLVELIVNSWKREAEIDSLRREVAARQPAKIVGEVIAELEARAARADRCAGGDDEPDMREARSHFLGQTQAFREAIAIFKKRLPPST